MGKQWSIGSLLGQSQRSFANNIMKLMPDKKIKTPEDLDFDWATVKKSFRFRHFVYALFAVTGVLILANFFYQVPFLKFSIASTIGDSFKYVINIVIGLEIDVSFILNWLLILALIMLRDDVGSIVGVGPFNISAGLPKFAIREELVFRAGSERWNLVQKLRACITFGLIHFTMIIVPLSTAFALSFGGFVFMGVYLATFRRTHSVEEAIKESAVVHTVYNMIILGIFITLVLLLALTTVILLWI